MTKENFTKPRFLHHKSKNSNGSQIQWFAYLHNCSSSGWPRIPALLPNETTGLGNLPLHCNESPSDVGNRSSVNNSYCLILSCSNGNNIFKKTFTAVNGRYNLTINNVYHFTKSNTIEFISKMRDLFQNQMPDRYHEKNPRTH